jgi:hypothetical protein
MTASRQLALGPALALLAAVALACSALAACGSAVAAGAGGGGLCSSADRVDRLVVERVNLIRQNHPRFTFPAKITVSDPAQARSVAQAVCALPPMPSGSFSCPADSGIIYWLTFTADGNKLPPVRVEATGCGEVRGIGQIRWTVHSPGFWRTLGTAMGIGHPNNSTFSGTTGSPLSLLGNVVECSFLRILVVSCTLWSANAFGRMPLSRTVVALVTRLRMRSA